MVAVVVAVAAEVSEQNVDDVGSDDAALQLSRRDLGGGSLVPLPTPSIEYVF